MVRLPPVVTVSYTHLDVYKRQVVVMKKATAGISIS